MATKKWFFLINNEVQGPYLESEINNLAQKHADGLVWGQGLNEWIRPSDWQKTLNELQQVLSGLQADMTPQWRMKQGEFEAGPFIYDQLLQVLKAHADPAAVLIYQDQDASGGWKSIYSYPTLVEEVGITRRTHERVPISGIFRYEKDGASHDCLLSSISEGGLGLLEAQGLSVGDTVKGVIQSPQLPTAINCSVEALYKQEDGSWGTRFVGLPLEAKSLIVAYTQKFQK